MLPLTAGFLIAGPISGHPLGPVRLAPFASGGMIAAAISFALLELLPVNFSYWAFALILLLNGPRDGRLRRAQPGRGHEQPAAAAPGGRCAG